MNVNLSMDQPLAGLQNPVDDGQRIFRSVLDAMAHPGKIVSLNPVQDAPAPLNRATAAVCLSLVDFETSLWTDPKIAASGAAITHLRFHCGCPFTTNPGDAHTALVSEMKMLANLPDFCVGTDERPDLSTTVIVQVPGFERRAGRRLTGPGIQTVTPLHVQGADAAFWKVIQANTQIFPRGVDFILTTDEDIVCLPRTTRVEV